MVVSRNTFSTQKEALPEHVPYATMVDWLKPERTINQTLFAASSMNIHSADILGSIELNKNRALGRNK